MEAAGWERAHGYASNEETLLQKYRNQVPVREHEWDARHFWEVSNAEHLELSESVGMINLSHFAIYDISGPDAESLLEHLAVAKVGDDTPIGRGIYTHFLDHEGGIRADLTIVRLAVDAYRVICGGDTGHRDLMWIQSMAELCGADIRIDDRTESIATLGLWGPKARETLAGLMMDQDSISNQNFPFATAKQIDVRGIPIWAFRISYVGEQGWELYVPFPYGLRLWDLLYGAGVVPVGIETYSSSRRLEKSLRVQNGDLLTDYNLYEAGLARPLVKKADFYGKNAYLEQRDMEEQVAYLCTFTMLDNTDQNGVKRYPVGEWPILTRDTKEVIVDSKGRRSYATDIAFGPSIGINIVMGYIPAELAKEGNEFVLEYFCEHYPLRLEKVGYGALFDPGNERPKS